MMTKCELCMENTAQIQLEDEQSLICKVCLNDMKYIDYIELYSAVVCPYCEEKYGFIFTSKNKKRKEVLECGKCSKKFEISFNFERCGRYNWGVNINKVTKLGEE